MIKYFSDNPTNANRALQIWLILVGVARNRQTITYLQLARMMGYKKGQGTLAQKLGHVAYYCIDNGLPGLTSLVVGSAKGRPGAGIPVDDPDAERQKVYKYKWQHVYPPTPRQLAIAYKKLKD